MVITQAQPLAGGSRHHRGDSRLRRIPLPVWIGVAVAGIDFIGAGIPSYWGDEAASVMSGTRSLPSLLQELSTVDAVHGVYYMLLHVWMWVFGSGEWATRALSSIGIGLLAAGTLVLGTSWFGKRVAFIGGALIAVLPRASLLAVETRGYALSAAVAVWLVVLATRLIHKDSDRGAWIWFGVLTGLASWFFLYLLMLPMALLPLLWRVRHRGMLLRHARTAALTAVAIALPILLVAVFQRGQLRFLAHRSYMTLTGALVTPWFGTVTAALVLWALLLAGVVLGMRDRRRRAEATALVLWAAAPAAVLLTRSVAVTPTYNPRYLSFSLAAVALLIALGVSGLFELARAHLHAPAIVTATVLAVLLLSVTVPQYLHQRGPYAKDGGADFRYAAHAVAQLAHPGDAVLFGDAPRPSRAARLAYRLYPQDFRGLADPQLVTPFDQTSGLWDVLADVSTVAPALRERTAWLLETHGAHSGPADRAALQHAGYRLIASDSIHRTTIYEYQRGQGR